MTENSYDVYTDALRRVLPFVLDAPADEIRAAVAQLIAPRDDFAAGGSSFAVVARPRWRLFMSAASASRLGDPRVVNLGLTVGDGNE